MATTAAFPIEPGAIVAAVDGGGAPFGTDIVQPGAQHLGGCGGGVSGAERSGRRAKNLPERIERHRPGMRARREARQRRLGDDDIGRQQREKPPARRVAL